MKDKWPFYPERLTDIMGSEMVSFMQSGCADMLGRPLLIVEVDPNGAADYFRTIIAYRNFEQFCLALRGLAFGEQEPLDIVGGDDVCRRCYARHAKEILQSSGRNRQETVREEEELIYELSQSYACDMGLVGEVAPIVVGGKTIAAMFAGQAKPSEKKEVRIIRQIDLLGIPESEHGADVQITDGDREVLKKLIEPLERHKPEFLDELRKAAKLISSFAGKEYELQKTDGQSRFHRELLNIYHSHMSSNPSTTADVSGSLNKVLDEVQKFCGATYVAFFSWTDEHSSILLDLAGASSTIPKAVRDNSPHFNWNKAEFPSQQDDRDLDEEITNSLPLLLHRAVRTRDVRFHKNAEFFYDASCVLPVVLADTYRAMLVFGPFESSREVIVENELLFLRLLADTIGTRFLMRFLSVESEQKEATWRDIADLIAHEVGNRGQPIMAKLDLVGLYLDGSPLYSLEEAKGATSMAQNMVEQLSRYASATFHVYQARVLEEEMDFQLCSLSEIKDELIEEFRDYAKLKGISIRDKFPSLPEVEINREGIRIALRKIIDNAIKYSHKDSSYIAISGSYNDNIVEISVEDFGLGLPEKPEEKEELFEKGAQWEIRGQAKDEPGMGFGLWEALKHVQAHGGMIVADSFREDRVDSKPGEGYRTIFTIRLPVRQALTERI